MPEVYEVEVVTNETATASTVVSSQLEVEVHLERASLVGQIPVPEAVEVTLLGPVKMYLGDAVVNAGNAPALMMLEASDPVPGGTPPGTIILRKP